MIVVDANVLLSALRSSRGASNRLLAQMLLGEIPFAVSPAVALEYEDVLKRTAAYEPGAAPTVSAVDTVLDAIFARAALVSPFFRFRPFLADPGDDLSIECALAAGATIIVSRDKHFLAPVVARFGLTMMNAGELIAERERQRDQR